MPTVAVFLISDGNPTTLITSATASAPLAVFVPTAGYLTALLSTLGQCLSGTTSDCSSTIDADYLKNGYASSNGGFRAYRTGIRASGATITGMKTLAYWSARQSALGRILHTSSGGQQNFALTVVQQKTTGDAWNMIGNRQAYDITLKSFVLQRQYLDPTNVGNSRHEAGLGIDITYGSGTGNNLMPLASNTREFTFAPNGDNSG